VGGKKENLPIPEGKKKTKEKRPRSVGLTWRRSRRQTKKEGVLSVSQKKLLFIPIKDSSEFIIIQKGGDKALEEKKISSPTTRKRELHRS